MSLFMYRKQILKPSQIKPLFGIVSKILFDFCTRFCTTQISKRNDQLRKMKKLKDFTKHEPNNISKCHMQT